MQKGPQATREGIDRETIKQEKEPLTHMVAPVNVASVLSHSSVPVISFKVVTRWDAP